MKKKMIISYIFITFCICSIFGFSNIYASKYLVRGVNFEKAYSSTDSLEKKAISYIENTTSSPGIHNFKEYFKKYILDEKVYEIIEIEDTQFDTIANSSGSAGNGVPNVYKNEVLIEGETYYTICSGIDRRVMSKQEVTGFIGNFYNDQDFWGSASSWFGSAREYETPEGVSTIIDTFSKMINVVGTTVIVIATIVLGIKYIIGTVESQTSAKEGLITLFVACIFFFGWTSISNLLFPNNEFIFTSNSDTSYENMVGRIFSTFTYIAQFIVVAAIIYVGIKYIFAGATGRAELKGKSVYFIIGIILVFATTNVLSFISNIISDTL